MLRLCKQFIVWTFASQGKGYWLLVTVFLAGHGAVFMIAAVIGGPELWRRIMAVLFGTGLLWLSFYSHRLYTHAAKWL